MAQPTYTLDFSAIGMRNLAQVGGKNASLGELINHLKPLGVGVLDGFAITADAYRVLLDRTEVMDRLKSLLAGLNVEDVTDLSERAHAARAAVLQAPLPPEIAEAIVAAYQRLSDRLGRTAEVAVGRRPL